MTIIKVDSTVASYIKALASEKQSDGADKLRRGSIPSLRKVSVQNVIPGTPLKMLNHCMQLIEDALPTDPIARIDTKEI